jgi:peptide/nickel transport system ATP-binding protein
MNPKTKIVDEVVTSVTFDVEPGERVAIVGESGSGKSTTAHALINLLAGGGRLLGGSITLDGREVAHLPERAWPALRGKHVGLVPQDPGISLDPVVRIGEQVAEAVRQHTRIPKRFARARAVDLLREVGIDNPEGRAAQFPHELSGGMRQRVLIAIAIASEPELIIADEPTSALDVTVQRKILDLLDQVVEKSGAAWLFITHDLSVAAERSDRIIVMHQGTIVEQGPTEQLLNAPTHEYTRRLLAADPTHAPYRPFTSEQTAKNTSVALEVRGLSKSFALRGTKSVVRAVQDVSFSVPRGQTLALVGESGSGKSTITRLVLGLERPDRGQVLCDGVVVVGAHVRSGWTVHREALRTLKGFRRRAGLVYQNPYASLDPSFSVFELIAEPLRAVGVPQADIDSRVPELLDAVGLSRDFTQRRPRALSGGQRQRVAIARALAFDPEILILDEPTSALDVSVQKQILDLLVTLQEERGLTYLFVTHDLAVVRGFAHRVVVMKAGEAVEEGDTRDVFEQPQHHYTRELLASRTGDVGSVSVC